MTQTEIRLGELQKVIPHLQSVAETGWVLTWGESEKKAFQLVCKGASVEQIAHLDQVMSQAHEAMATQAELAQTKE